MNVSARGAAMDETSAHVLHLNLIGGFELSVGDALVDVADPARRLLAFLALHRIAQPRALVAGSLWPDKTEARALANLRSALWAVNDDGHECPVESTGGCLRLRGDVEVDVKVVEDEGWSMIERSRAGIAAVGTALVESRLATSRGLLFDDLLPGWYDDWVLLERERFAELQVHVLDEMVPALTAAGSYSLAIHLALRLVALDPLRERSQLALIRAYLTEGSFGRAKRQHRAFEELMQCSLGSAYLRSFGEVMAEATPL
jgi:DNA-binding SARP family transcriptional activator